MVDFTSALYLGLRHPSDSLGDWEALTLGRPSALREPPDAESVAADLARLQGCEAGALVPSTLHLFLDLFAVLGQGDVVIMRDAGAYPIARWGTESARAMGAQVRTFPHHDAVSLERMIADAASRGLKPVIAADGYCPRCGHVAPVGRYAQLAKQAGGYLVLDDTQALGVLGERPDAANPYGSGGGGSLRWHHTFGGHIITGSSLAKGFGVPVAVLAGERGLVDRFRRESQTRLHCSPPSVAVIRAARCALRTNHSRGDALRRRLLHLVVRLRMRLIGAGLRPSGQLPFPVQTFVAAQRWAAQLHEQLLGIGIVGLLTTACSALVSGLTLLVTARHGLAEIERAGQAIARAVHRIAARPDWKSDGGIGHTVCRNW
jgi:8-amino-7-oxononanoate synthase